MLAIALALLQAADAAQKPVAELPPLTLNVSAMSPDQTRLALGTTSGFVSVIGVPSGSRHIHPTASNEILDLAWSTDSLRIAVRDRDGLVSVVDAATGASVQSFQTLSAQRASDYDQLAFGASNSVLVITSWRGAQIWKMATGEFIAEVPPSQKAHITTFAVQRGGEMFAVGDTDGRVSMWRSVDGARVAELAPFDRPHTSFAITALDFSPTGSSLAIGNGSPCVRLWNWTKSGDVQELRHPEFVLFEGDGQRVGCVRFSRDGTKLLSTVFPNYEARVWDVATGRETFALTFDTGSDRPFSGWISRDGSYISLFNGWPVTRVGDAPEKKPFSRTPDRSAPAHQSDGDYAWSVVNHELIVRKVPDEVPVMRVRVRR